MEKVVPKKKLIEVALPLPEINDASAYDKMPGIGPHPKGIHHWWARLPLPTARAILFASVVDDPQCFPDRWPTEELQAKERERLFGVIRSLLQKNSQTHPDIYEEASAEMLRSCDGRLPAFFDPFAGGGSIPLEAHRLGFDVRAGDLNPVAVLLNKCNLELAPRWSGRAPINADDRTKLAGGEGWNGTSGLAADIRYYAAAIRRELDSRLGTFYPKVEPRSELGAEKLDVVAWIWARTVRSPNPATHGRYVPLVSSFVLSSKGENTVYARVVQDANSNDGWYFEVREAVLSKDDISRAKLGTKAGKGQDFICAISSDSTPIKRSYIQAEGKAGRLGLRLMAVVANGPRGRVYLTPDQHQQSVAMSAGSDERVAETRTNLLYGALPTRAEITGGVCTAYGLSTWGHLFVDRQVMSLLAISDAIIGIPNRIESDAIDAGLSRAEASEYAATITTFLALAADRTADFNNSLCRWSSSNQKVMNLFGKQALPMVFDFAEANILGESVGAWLTCSSYVADCVRVIGGGGRGSAGAFQFDAAANEYGRDGLLISTDPPYYNNISYAVWART